jgi:phosphate transport system protein
MQTLHTDPLFAAELDGMQQDVLLMAAWVERMLRDSWTAFHGSNPQLAKETARRDHQIDALERDLDARCLRILARWKPVASDLRFVTSVFKLVTNLERMGDLSAAICRRTLQLAPGSAPARIPPLVTMAEMTTQMVADAMDAFAGRDQELAKAVIARDRFVDAQYAQCFPVLLAMMSGEHSQMQAAMCLADVGKSLERIADLATNIGELVVFVVDGHVIKHGRLAVVSRPDTTSNVSDP